jgi:hypothetical protein
MSEVGSQGQKWAIRNQNRSVSNYFNQDSLSPSAVKFAVENLFPRPEIQFALRNCDDDFSAHDLTFKVGVSVVFASPVVPICVRWCVRSEFFQPHLVIVMEPRLIVIDEHRSGDVHGVDQTKTLHYAAPVNQFLDLRCDVDEPASVRYFEPKMFRERFHIREVDS